MWCFRIGLHSGKTALLILQSGGIFLFVCCRSYRSFRVSANGFQIRDGRAFQHKCLCGAHKTYGYHKTVCRERNPAYCKCAVGGSVTFRSRQVHSLYFVRLVALVAIFVYQLNLLCHVMQCQESIWQFLPI